MDRRDVLAQKYLVLPDFTSYRVTVMISTENLSSRLCRAFCTEIGITAVPAGYAVKTAFRDRSGDPISFYISETDSGFVLEDDGEFLSTLVATGVEVREGQRGQLLDAILADGGAYCDVDTLEIRTSPFEENAVEARIMDFLSAQVRVRDLAFLTTDFARSTFREDATRAIEERLSVGARVVENAPVTPEYSEFPSDLVIYPESGRPAAVYFATSNDRLNEALMLHQEAQVHNDNGFGIVAMIEDAEMSRISKRNFQRAQNRAIAMPIFKNDERAAVNLVMRQLKAA